MATPPTSPDAAELARLDDEVSGLAAVMLTQRMRASAAARDESVRTWLLRAIRTELERLEPEDAGAERNTTTPGG
jgi:hypothetical protein